MPVIYFVRHGETDWNVAGRLQGTRDIPMNGRGRDQADAVGRTLRHLLPDPAATRFVSSPLGRARETMERLRAAMGMPPQDYELDASLAEICFGQWEGLTWPEVHARDPEGARARETDKWGFVPPGGESYAMLVQRVRPWLEANEHDVVAVSHGGIARALLALAGGVPEREAPLIPIQQGRVLVFEQQGHRWV